MSKKQSKQSPVQQVTPVTPEVPVAEMPWAKLAMDFRKPQDLVPCLIGGTGSGKTTMARLLAESLGYKFVSLVLSHKLPEDINGLPILDSKTRLTEYTRPEWLDPDQPTVVLLDELDKARTENQDAVLCFLAERRVHNYHLHPDSIILAAMQPLDVAQFMSTETGRALCARLVWFPITYNRARLAAMYALPRLCELATGKPPEVPHLEIGSDRQVDFAIRAWMAGHNVLFNIFSPTEAQLLNDILSDESHAAVYTKQLFAKPYASIPEALWEGLTPDQCPPIIQDVASECDPQTLGRLLVLAHRDSYTDTGAAARQALYEGTRKSSKLCGDWPEDKIVPVLSDAIRQIGENEVRRAGLWKELQKAYADLREEAKNASK